MAEPRYQPGSVRLEGQHWILRRRVDGRETRIQLGTLATVKSRLAARRKADAYLERIEAGPAAVGERTSLERYSKFFLEKICEGMKPSTRATYASAFRQYLVPALGRRALSDIGERDATELVASMRLAGRMQRTISLVLNVLAFALRKARANGYAARELSLKGLKLNRRLTVDQTPRSFTLDEIVRILDAARFPWRALYALLALTGMRCGEALGLTWNSIRAGELQIVLSQAAYMGRVQTTKTEGSAATLHAPQRLIDILSAYRSHQEALQGAASADTALLFPSPRDASRPIWSDGVRKHHFAPLLVQLGIAPAGLHAFRHSFATLLLKAGRPASVVKSMMRHARMETTMRYTHVTLEDQRLAADGFAGAVLLPGIGAGAPTPVDAAAPRAGSAADEAGAVPGARAPAPEEPT